MADDGVETGKMYNEDGENKKVSAIFVKYNWTRKRKRRSITDKDGLVDIPCLFYGCDHQFKFWDNVVAVLPNNSNTELELVVHRGCKTVQWINH